MSSLRAKIVRKISSAYVKRFAVASIDIQATRKRLDRLGRLLRPAFGVKVEQSEVHGLYAEWLIPKDAMDGKVLLYLHGGGYMIGGCDMHRKMVSHIAKAGRIKALLPEYRLAPEHKYPNAIEDAVGCYKALLADGIGAEDIIIAGDSAGGGLTVGTTLALRDAGEPLPAALLLLSPFLDVTGSGASMQTRRDQDPWFRAEDLPFVADHYCEPHQRRYPEVSPVFANIEGMPRMFIQVGDDEILLSDSERLADECVAAGIDVELQVWPEMWHVFQMFIGKMPESRDAIQQMGQYIQTIWR